MSSAHAPTAPHDGPLKYNECEQFGKASPGKIAMWLFLGTDAFSFAGLLIGYGVLRAKYWEQWPNPVEALGGVGLSGFMTFWLICSSVSMVMAIDACKRKNRQAILTWLGLTCLGGLGFLGMQVYEYSHLFHEGITFAHYRDGIDLFGSTFFSITGFHGLHVFTGTLYLIYMFKLALDGRFDKGDYNLLEIAGLFWHFVDLVWILVFTFVYLL